MFLVVDYLRSAHRGHLLGLAYMGHGELPGGPVGGHQARNTDRRSGKGGALLRRPPLRTARATHRGIRLKQAAGAIQLRCAVLLRWRARCPRWQEACTRRVWSSSGCRLGLPW